MDTRRRQASYTLAVAVALLAPFGCGPERAQQSSTQKPVSQTKHKKKSSSANVAPAKAKPVETKNAKASAVVKPVELKLAKKDPKDWDLIPSQSFVGIEVIKGTGEHYARFGKVSGHAIAAGKGFAGIQVAVLTESFEADVPAFAEHVRSEHFLDVKQFPMASFVSTSLRKEPGPVKGRHMLEGDLTLRGKKQRVALQADLSSKGEIMELQGRVPLDFKAFGMSQAGIANELIDGVELSLRLKFKRPTPTKSK